MYKRQNQDWFTEADYDNDELDRFPAGAGFPGKSSADWGWVQHMHASLNATGRAAVVLDTGAASVSYTHLDVYKRQLLERTGNSAPRGMVVHDRTRLNDRLPPISISVPPAAHLPQIRKSSLWRL